MEQASYFILATNSDYDFREQFSHAHSSILNYEIRGISCAESLFTNSVVLYQIIIPKRLISFCTTNIQLMGINCTSKLNTNMPRLAVGNGSLNASNCALTNLSKYNVKQFIINGVFANILLFILCYTYVKQTICIPFGFLFLTIPQMLHQ